MRVRRCQNQWIWMLLFGAASGVLAYGRYWRHGPYHDDYFYYSLSFSNLIDHIGVEVRPVGKLIAAIVYSQPEAVARLLAAATLIGTALLAGMLVIRLAPVALAGASAGLLCLIPSIGLEATTWTSAMVHFLPAGFFALAAANLFLSSLQATASPPRGRWLALLSGLLLVLGFGCIEPAANFYILFAALALAQWRCTPHKVRPILISLFWATVVAAVLGAFIYATFYVDASQVSRRGKIEIPSLERLGAYLLKSYRLGLGGSFGRDILQISFKLGWRSLTTDLLSATLAAVALALGVGLNLAWKPQPFEKPPDDHPAAAGVILMGACLLAAFACLVLPAVLLSAEPGSPRMAYLPGVCLALFTGLAIARSVVACRRQALQRVILAMVTVAVLILSVRTLGYTRMYRLRYEYDRMMVNALLKAAPPGALAGHRVTFLPFSTEENFLGYPVKNDPRFILIGGFTSPNSIRHILESAYPRTRIAVIRPGYGDFKWHIVPGARQTLMISGFEADPAQAVDPGELIIFRCRGDGTADLAERILFMDNGRNVVTEVRLPWAMRLREAYGTTTFELKYPLEAYGRTE